MDFYICWSIDYESLRPEVNDVALGVERLKVYVKLWKMSDGKLRPF